MHHNVVHEYRLISLDGIIQCVPQEPLGCKLVAVRRDKLLQTVHLPTKG